MTAGRVLLWRHGRTAHNASGRLQGQVDIPLDDVGLWQARTAAAALAARYRPTRVVSSDLSRARATADALAAQVGLELVLDPRVRERSFGDWEGMTSDEIAARWPDEHAAWARGGEPHRPGGESRADVAERMREAVGEHAAGLGAGDTLVVVTHGAAISLAVGALLGLPSDWRGITGPSNAHWAELHAGRLSHGGAWRLTGYNLGPTDASADWNAGPDQQVRDPD
ncbi:histidine phosphatase family protein [Cellulomonas chengniuliangii]|uniref:histidine phosphatase family protein n=1 Tax=Cellulomonas chengniuliangii TaxID=2968084 RepID=UPI001D0F2399|nr:histidine phosphatase family protein [Cellulomonas chengniuliangii]MCC2318198.1 histidine phosphatase family protein [Cellulomonas chengniuliangii]